MPTESSTPDDAPSDPASAVPAEFAELADLNDPLTDGAGAGQVGDGQPPVVVVIPTRDPGPEFDELLTSLSGQDYQNLAVLVVDAGSLEDPTARVADRLPSAFVRTTDRSASFASAANEVLGTVEGGVFYLFLHDDLRLQPDTIKAMVSEAFRANAGIVGAKLVEWDRPERLIRMGSSVDKFGFESPEAERGELDQEQHDVVSDVFMVAAHAMLVRADLFEDLEGFATDIAGFGEALDLCWRTRVAGGRVIVMPAARVEHAERSDIGDPDVDHHRLALRHQARIMLTCYSPLTLLRVLPQAFVYSVVDAVVGLLSGRPSQFVDVTSAYWWNLRHLPTTLRIRVRVKRARRSPDSEVRAHQVHGSARLTAFARGARAAGTERLPAAVAAARDLPASWREGSGLVGAIAAIALGIVFVVGSRQLITGGLPVVREFVPVGVRGDLIRQWWDGWTSAGIGADRPAATAFSFTALADLITFSSTGFVKTVGILAAWPIGAVGAWRLLAGAATRWARLGALGAYVLVALPYDAIAEGRYQALAAYAVMPWILRRLLLASESDPFPTTGRSTRRDAIILAVWCLAGAIIAPIVLVFTAGMAIAIGLTLIASSKRSAGVRVMSVGLIGTAVAAVALLPDLIRLFGSPRPWVAFFGGTAPLPADLDLQDLVRLSSGPMRGGVLLGAVSFTALLVLLLGRGWRLRWGFVGWVVTLTSWTAIVGLAQIAPDAALPALAVLLVPSLAGIMLAFGMGTEAIVSDVLGGEFGWRQLVGALGGIAVAAATLPLLLATVGGRWDSFETDHADALSTLQPDDPSQVRSLWLGAPDDLPMRSSPLSDGVGWALVDGVLPTQVAATDVGSGRAEDELQTLLETSLDVGSGRLGAELAGYGIGFVVVAAGPVPESTVEPTAQVAAVEDMLAAQLDLDVLDVAPGLEVYANPGGRTVRSAHRAAQADLPAETASVLDDGRVPVRFEGTVPTDSEVTVALNLDRGWHLEVDGRTIEQQATAVDVQRYDVEQGGEAVLSFRGGVWHRLLLIMQIGLVIALLFTARRAVRNRS